MTQAGCSFLFLYLQDHTSISFHLPPAWSVLLFEIRYICQFLHPQLKEFTSSEITNNKYLHPKPAPRPNTARLQLVLSYEVFNWIKPSIKHIPIRITEEIIPKTLVLLISPNEYIIWHMIIPELIARHLQQIGKQKPLMCGARSLQQLHKGIFPNFLNVNLFRDICINIILLKSK